MSYTDKLKLKEMQGREPKHKKRKVLLGKTEELPVAWLKIQIFLMKYVWKRPCSVITCQVVEVCTFLKTAKILIQVYNEASRTLTLD